MPLLDAFLSALFLILNKTLSCVSQYIASVLVALLLCAERLFTTTIFSSIPCLILRVIPSVRSLLAFARFPSIWIFPPRIAAFAKPRVLKKRAAHSHLSRRTFFPTLFSLSKWKDLIKAGDRCKTLYLDRILAAVRFFYSQ